MLKSLCLLCLVGMLMPGHAQQKPSLVTRGTTNFHLVDLGKFVSKRLVDYPPGQSWSAPPRGAQTLDGVPFFLEGKIELTGMSSARDGKFFPARLNGVPVGKKGQRIHVLHGTGYDDRDGSPTYKLVLHYADGEQRGRMIAYGVHLRNWYLEPREANSELEDANSAVAWAGSSADTDRVGSKLRLFRTTLLNPRPAREIKTIDLVSLFGRATPVIVALTVEDAPVDAIVVTDDAEPLDDSEFREELEVWVIDPVSGAGLPGAKVKVDVAEARRSFSFGEYDGNAQGRFVVEYPPRSIVSMNLQVSVPGYPLKLAAVPRSDEGRFPGVLKIKMEGGARVGGTVRSEGGGPIQGARVQINGVIRDEVGQILPKKLDELRTDENGGWASTAVAKDFSELNFQLTHPEYLPGDFDQETEPRADGQNITAAALLSGKALMLMKPGYRVEGVVKNPESRPISGAEVVLRLNTDSPTNRTQKADDAGRFKFVLMETGEAQLAAFGSGFAPEMKTIMIEEGFKPVELTLAPGLKLKGVVVDAATNPIAGAAVRLETWKSTSLVNWKTETGSDGSFAWDSAPRDGATYSVGMPGYVNQSFGTPPPEGEDFRITLIKSFLLTGRVTDADSGEAVPRFQIVKGIKHGGGDHDMPNWERYNAINGRDGDYSVRHDQPYGSKIHVLVEAEGYLPQMSPGFSPSGWHTNNFTLKKGEGPRGVVKLREGRPVTGAQVALLSGGYLSLGAAQFRNSGTRDTHMTTTDTEGRFALPTAFARELVAVHELGYGELSLDDFTKRKEVVLEAWGRVEGTLKHGTRPGTNEEVMLTPRRTGPGSVNYDWSNFKVVTDDEGRFAFTNVPPGARQLVQLVKSGGRSWMWSHLLPIEVKAGEITRISYGGAGRPVVGKVIASDPSRMIEWQSGHHTLNTRMPKPPKGLKTQEEWQAWQDTAEYKAARERYRYYAVRFAPDGSFRVEDIPPGEYSLSFSFVEPEDTPGRMGRNIGNLSKEFQMPAIPGGVSDEPLDLGQLDLSLRGELRVGALAPAFEVKALDGKALKLADFRGKFVLLDFWATWCGPCVAELPELKALFDEFGKDERFVMLSLSLDAEIKEPQDFVRKNKLEWVQGFLGEWSGTKLPNQYGVEGIPALFLIGPDGNLVAKDFRGPAAKSVVAKAFKERSTSAN